jgi:hypothetical protein
VDYLRQAQARVYRSISAMGAFPLPASAGRRPHYLENSARRWRGRARSLKDQDPLLLSTHGTLRLPVPSG